MCNDYEVPTTYYAKVPEHASSKAASVFSIREFLVSESYDVVRSQRVIGEAFLAYFHKLSLNFGFLIVSYGLKEINLKK